MVFLAGVNVDRNALSESMSSVFGTKAESKVNANVNVDSESEARSSQLMFPNVSHVSNVSNVSFLSAVSCCFCLLSVF